LGGADEGMVDVPDTVPEALFFDVVDFLGEFFESVDVLGEVLLVEMIWISDKVLGWFF
jgi:hypothetical protein